MVKKKVKTPKKSKRRVDSSWHEEDVQVNTGLPPQVEGQLRCFCRVSVTQLTWGVPNTPDVTYVSLKWWGEPGDGVLFRPVDLKKGVVAGHAKTTARFPVRSGPKQFAAYLADMSSLMLEVVSGPMQVPIGTVEVPNLGQLAPNRPINGLFPIISPTDERIGELHVSLMIESLMASYDSTGSIPTTDLSMETYASHVTQDTTVPKQSRPVPHSDQPRKPTDDPFISPASHQNTDAKVVNGYAEDLRQHLRYDGDTSVSQYPNVNVGSTVAITTNGDVVRTNYGAEGVQANKENQSSSQPASRQPDSDLLSVLLDRGNKLREQMIVSSLQDKSNKGHDSAGATSGNFVASHDVPVGVPQRKPVDMSIRSTDGSFLQEILKAEKLYGGVGYDGNIDENAVDLVFGGQLTDDIRVLKNLHGSPTQSISGDDDILSDNEDPIHSESLLNELFYKNTASADELSDLSGDEERGRRHSKHLDDDANMRPPSRSSSVSSLNLAFPATDTSNAKKSRPTKSPKGTPKRKSRVKLRRKSSKRQKGSRSRSRSQSRVSECSDSDAGSTVSVRSESSRVSFDMVPSDIEEPPTRDETSRRKKTPQVDGLSVERLTLLGRVHVARVTIDTLQLTGTDLDSSAVSKPKLKSRYGMKPKPSPKGKKACTYFIEYQFPVVATSRDKYSPNAMATEVMRVVSRNVKDGAVTFNHRSVFPVMFDGTAVEKWWKSALVFKLYSRTAGQKVPSLIGSCGVPLKSILKSESLYVNKEMEVRLSEKSGANNSINTSRHNNLGVLGGLKVIVELASDSKEFPTQLARTKLAELTGKAKIVPIAHTVQQSSGATAGPSRAGAAPKPPPAPSAPATKPSYAEDGRSAPRPYESRSRSASRSPVRQPAARLRVDPPARPEGLSMPVPVSVQHFDGDQNIVHYSDPINQQQQGEVMTLHALLLIPDGQNITMQGVPSLSAAKRHPVFQKPNALSAPGVRARDMCVRNTYLVCRMFWCDESVHSSVCWGTSEPQFKFQQIAPVLMSQSLLERLKNNFMIIEVWDKKTSADNDKLVGIVKLSLHQFYMSFRDKRIASALLKSQYPVIAVENYLPVIDVFSGSQYGQINVLLAMGSAEQVAHLVRLKTEGVSAASAPERPHHYLERQDLMHQGDTVPAQIGTEAVVEHVFEIVIEGVRGLAMEGMIWGEADCFVQYHFPTQSQTQPPGAPVIRHAVPTMKAFRTATTLCVADPTFHDVTRHRILLPHGTPVQRELLTACANAGSSSGGVPFELWCRYYHPNVRDQCMAKASLPLAKLCAMVTMQKRGEPSVQTFSFQLNQVSSATDDRGRRDREKQSIDAGMMDITIHYKNQSMQSETSMAAASKNLTGAQVCLSVGVVRACGLKAAAEHASQHDQGMQYPAEVGVNAYVRIKLSFLGSDGQRVSRTIARSFAPEFSHFVDFPVPLLWTEADSDALCLAELLESGEATFEVWHQVPGMSSDLDQQLSALTADGVRGRQLVEKTADVLLGTATLPLMALLSNRTGINGWFPVNIPISAWSQEANRTSEQQPQQQQEVLPGTSGLQRVGGGLEISVKFGHHDDRERVIHAARGVGWSPIDDNIIEQEDDWQSEDEGSNRYHHINITIDQLSFPLQNALIAGQNTLDKTAQCYIRYKFYDKAAVMSKLCGVVVTNEGYIAAKPKNKHDLHIPDSSMFKWYLREERLEVQVWVTYGARAGDQQRPKHRDKLIGTAYIPLDTLGDQRRKQHRVSGMFPLYKPGACDMGGAYIRGHISTKPQFGRNAQSEVQEGLITLDGEDIDVDYDPDDSFHQIVSHKPGSSPVKKGSSSQKEGRNVVEEEDGLGSSQGQTTQETTFSAVIQVERAFHLPHMHDKQNNTDYMPNTYVSYPTAEGTIPSYTSVFHNSDNPVWDHEQEARLSNEMLQHENKHLVFKVWHKPDAAPKSPDKLTDRVLGFVSVDLTPLSNGMLMISGWYNILDFNGQVKGQIKINVIPQQSVISRGGAVSQAGTSHQLDPTLGSFYSLPAGGGGLLCEPTGGALSMPLGSDLSHFQQHYDQVRQHHEVLQHQLQEHIQQFLRQQEECTGQGQGGRSDVTGHSSQEVVTSMHGAPVSQMAGQPGESSGISMYRREPSIHWRPSIPEHSQDNDSSRSYLFTALRRQMLDLDEITSNLRTKLSFPAGGTQLPPSCDTASRVPEWEIPPTSQSGQYPLTSTQSDLTFDLPRSQRDTPRDDLGNTGSMGGAESARTCGDSSQYDREQDQDTSAPVSQRSASDRLDTLRSGTTPRDFLDSGIPQTNNNSNTEEPEQNMWMTLSPRESNDRKDEYAESGGFSYRHSPRDISYTPRDTIHTPRELSTHTGNGHRANDNSSGTLHTSSATSQQELEQMLNANMTNSIQQHIDNAKKLLSEVADSKTSDKKQMSIIQEHSENDQSFSEGEEGDHKYYHKYRDLLDNDDEVSDKDDENDDDDEGEVVVPRRINDVSGKFSPTGEIIMLSEEISQSVPYRVNSQDSREGTLTDSESEKSGHRTVPKESDSTKVNVNNDNEDILQDIGSDDDVEQPRTTAQVHMSDADQVVFDEKDSWLSDSDKEERDDRHMAACSQYIHSHGHLAKMKHQRQDSDTGYSSRDNVSESYLTPSAGGTNSETDMSRLHEHEHWSSDQRESSEDHMFIDRSKARLLANVELESTGGSFHGLRYDSGGPSRISSAGSRHTRKSSEPSVTESFDEKEEQDYIRHELEPINSERETIASARDSNPPRSARSEELNDFFSNDSQHRTVKHHSRSRSDSECSENSDQDNFRAENHQTDQWDDGRSDRLSGKSTPRDVTSARNVKSDVPNFFMPVQHLEESLRTLQVANNKTDPRQASEKAAAASEMVSKLTSRDKFAAVNTKSRLPTAEETKRIAKIFSSKFS